jgi:tetratricopeptide (TPR) repeat protein
MPAILIRRALLMLVLMAGPAAAQVLPTADDLRALRFYIQENEVEAIAAELRRLSIEFPGWIPPDDLTQLMRLEPSSEIDAIYARIGANDIGGARRLLSETEAEFPDWSPPADLVAALQTAEAQIAFDRAISSRDLAAAVQLGVASPDLLRCNRINNTWRLAELQAALGNGSAALAAYRQILATCGNTTDLIATIEKANAVASVDELREIIAAARVRLPAATAQLNALEERLLAGRGEVTAVTETESATAVATPDATVAALAVPAPAAAAAPAPAPRPALPATAAPVQSQAPVVVAQSPLTALPSTGDGRVNSVRNAAAAEAFAECARLSTRPRSLEVAYERAWCVYNLDRPLEALALFSAAASGRLSGTAPRDARYGMALAYLELQMTEAASQIAASTDLTLEQRRTVEGIILDQRGVRAYQQEQYAQAIRFFDALEELEGSLRRDLRLLRGYAFLNSGDRVAAQREFQSLHDELATPDTRTALQALRG